MPHLTFLAVFAGAFSIVLVGAQDLFSDPNKPLYLTGKVVNRAGEPVPGVSVQIWQTDALSKYNHPRSADLDEIDPNFQHFGTSTDADGDGSFFFKTIVPGRYPQRPIVHIHFKVFDSNRQELLTSQLYFEDFDPPQSNGYTIGPLGDIVDRDGNQALASDDITLVVEMGGSGSLPLTRSELEGPFYPGSTTFNFDNDLTALGDQQLSDEEDPTVAATERPITAPTASPVVLFEPVVVLERSGVKERVDWGVNGVPFETIELSHCDRVIFRLASPAMSIFKMTNSTSFADCDFSGAVMKAPKANGTRVIVKSPARGGLRYLASGGQCESGVKITLNFVKAYSETFSCATGEQEPWKTLSVPTAGKCFERCRKKKGCMAYSFMEATMVCSLFKDTNGVTPDSSGAMTCAFMLNCI